MLSQYSWGDYFKFIAVIAVIYYSYVLIRYYREDIREWISNRGNPDQNKAELVDSDEEERANSPDTSNLYSTKQYTINKVSVQQTPAPAPAPSAQVHNTEDEIDLNGETIDDHESSGFRLPIAVDIFRPNEQSVSELQEIASRLETGEQGAVRPSQEGDNQAAKLAKVINDQQGNQAFSGISFNR